MRAFQGHVRVALEPADETAKVRAVPQMSYPLILTFGAESFSSSVVTPADGPSAPDTSDPLTLSFFAPMAALQFAVPGAQFIFSIPPRCTGTGVVLQVLST